MTVKEPGMGRGVKDEIFISNRFFSSFLNERNFQSSARIIFHRIGIGMLRIPKEESNKEQACKHNISRFAMTYMCMCISLTNATACKHDIWIDTVRMQSAVIT